VKHFLNFNILTLCGLQFSICVVPAVIVDVNSLYWMDRIWRK